MTVTSELTQIKNAGSKTIYHRQREEGERWLRALEMRERRGRLREEVPDFEDGKRWVKPNNVMQCFSVYVNKTQVCLV